MYELIRTLAMNSGPLVAAWGSIARSAPEYLIDACHQHDPKLQAFAHLRLRLASLSFGVGVLLAHPLRGLLELLVCPLGQAALVLVLLALALCGRSVARVWIGGRVESLIKFLQERWKWCAQPSTMYDTQGTGLQG